MLVWIHLQPVCCCWICWSTFISSSSFSQVTSGLGLPRVTQGNTALDSTRRVTLVGWRLICGSDGRTDKTRETRYNGLVLCLSSCVHNGLKINIDSPEIQSWNRADILIFSCSAPQLLAASPMPLLARQQYSPLSVSLTWGMVSICPCSLVMYRGS